MNIFSKHVAHHIVTLLFVTSITTQCMSSKTTTPILDSETTYVNLNNPTDVTNALITSANNLVNKECSSSKILGLALFNQLVLKEKGYEEAEKACLSIFAKKNNTAVKITLLDLLKALNQNNQAIETSLVLATKLFIDHKSHASKLNALREYAMNHLHELIVFKNIDLIPQETIVAAVLGSKDTNQNIQMASKNIMKLIFHKWQYPSLKPSCSEESNNEDSNSEDSHLNEIEMV